MQNLTINNNHPKSLKNLANNNIFCYNHQHFKQQALFLCLSQKCVHKRLLCRVCVQQNHKSHQYASIDFKNKHSKINMLRANSGYDKMRKSQQINSPIQRERAAQLFQEILQTPLYLFQKIKTIVQKLTKIKHFILQSFDPQIPIKNFHQILEIKQNQSKQQKIQEIVQIINQLSSKEYLRNSEQIDRSLQKILFQLKKSFTINKNNQSDINISDIFDEISAKVQQWSEFKSKNWNINTEKFKEQEKLIEQQIQPSILHHSRLHEQGAQKHIVRVSRQRKWSSILDWTSQGNQLKNLVNLNITCKNIKKIESFMLQPFPHLQTLNLQGNSIEKLQNFQFTLRLKTLNLTYNLISKIQNIECLTQLQDLRLGQNHIQVIQNISQLKMLHTLILYRNRVSQIGQQVLMLPSLAFLDLEQNYIDKNSQKQKQKLQKLKQHKVNIKI